MRHRFFNPYARQSGASETLLGSSRRDVIFGFGGEDTLMGSDGNDFLFGGRGDDQIDAGDGNDIVSGGRGDDDIRLGAGNDLAFGGRGDDTIAIGSGNDRVSGGKGLDTVIAEGSVNDYVIASHGWGFWRSVHLNRVDETGSAFEFNRLFSVEVIEFDDYTYYLDGRNNAAIANDDAVATDENAALTLDADVLLANDNDPDGDPLEITAVDATSVAGASVVLLNGQIIYTPGTIFDALAEGEVATDRFEYTVDDGNGGLASATVTVTITGRNDAPEITGPAGAAIAENTSGVVASFIATDADDASVTFSLSGADSAFFSVDADGNLSLQSAADFETPLDADGDNIYNVTISAGDAAGASAAQDFALTVTDVPEISVAITEIMYNPASAEDDWEWVEIVNTGAEALDLAGWVFDDSNTVAQSGANISAGMIDAGGSAILFNADDISEADFAAAWGEGINLIAVTGWGNASLNNGGDTVGLWSDFNSYSGDNVAQDNAVVSVTYDDAGGWPADNNAASIYLVDIMADANDGTNWALSVDGSATPYNEGETAMAAGGNSGADVGSPGGVIPVGDVLISEFRPNPAGTDPATTLVELSGNAGAFFEGVIVAIEGDPGGANPGDINSFAAVSGTFDANGLLTVEVPDLENPSFTLAVMDQFTGTTDTDIDADDDGTADDLSTFGTVYDAIGTPDTVGDETTLYGSQLGGADFSYTGAEPELIFREGSRGDLFAANSGGATQVFDTAATAIAVTEFDNDPTVATPDALNPTRQVGPAPLSLVINEIHADPAAGITGDANGDGTRDATDDEFVEIVNTGAETADLSGVTISDGVSVRHTFAEGTMLAAGAAFVVFGGGTPTGSFAGASVTTASSGSLGLNNSGDTVTLTGPDAVILDEVTYGSEGGADQSLTRSPDLTGAFVQHGDVSSALYSPGATADGEAFGSGGARNIALNELRVSQSGDDNDEFIELFASPGTSLDGVTLVGISGEFAPGQIDFTLDLSAGSFDANGIFMIARDTLGTGTFDAGDLVLPSSVNLFGSPATYLLVEDFTGAFGDDLDADDDGTLDAQPWGTVLDSVSMVDADATADQNYSDVVVGPDGSFAPAAIAAQPDGSDNYTILNFDPTVEDTPGELNVTGNSGATERLISEIQGVGASSALVGETVIVTAIVVGDFQDGDADVERNLSGFFLQEEAADNDADPLSSEGIFVFENTVELLADVSVGDWVTVTGVVSEAFGATQITASAVSITEAGAVADVTTLAATVDLDAAAAISDGSGGYVADLEAYEGMLITIPQTLTVSEAFNLDRFGEVRLTAGDRPEQFTQNNDPDAAGFDAYQQEIFSDTIIYDDGKTSQNPANVFPAADLNGDGVFNTADGFGMGDTVTEATGVLTFAFDEYRMHSVSDDANTFADTQTRDTSPPDMTEEGTGRAADIVISSFNVLNFFTTLDNGGAGSGPNALEPRGAETVEEYQRQLDKLITTLSDINADIFGLVELENEFNFDQNGDGTFAIQAIVDGMNAQSGPDTWAYVDPGRGFVDTGDAISVGMIYKLGSVTVDGDAQILDDTVVADLAGDYGSDPLFDGASTNRAPLAANFTYDYIDIGGNNVSETFTVAVTHMKSKGGTGTGGDADIGDGAGAFNETRTEGVEALVEWLSSDRIDGFAADQQILLGDLNAYAQEDPIDALRAADYTNLEEVYEPGSTTFVFDGQTGTLDYAFANTALLDNVTNAGAWNINSNEPDIYDYNLNLDSDLSDSERDPAIFDGDEPFRTSDHDPLLLGLNFSDTFIFA